MTKNKNIFNLNIQIPSKLMKCFNRAIEVHNSNILVQEVTKSSILRDAIKSFIKKTKSEEKNE